jgi:hypothetical protein
MPRDYNRDIVECARRLVHKLESGSYYTRNGEFSPKVRKEITRMVVHCKKKYESETQRERE